MKFDSKELGIVWPRPNMAKRIPNKVRQQCALMSSCLVFSFLIYKHTSSLFDVDLFAQTFHVEFPFYSTHERKARDGIGFDITNDHFFA